MSNTAGFKVKVKDFSEMLYILDDQGVSRTPVHTGYGLEIYENDDKQIQVVYNCRGDIREVTVNKGF